jgi:hypothetical protein
VATTQEVESLCSKHQEPEFELQYCQKNKKKRKEKKKAKLLKSFRKKNPHKSITK